MHRRDQITERCAMALLEEREVDFFLKWNWQHTEILSLLPPLSMLVPTRAVGNDASPPFSRVIEVRLPTRPAPSDFEVDFSVNQQALFHQMKCGLFHSPAVH